MHIKKHNSLTDGSVSKATRQVLPDRLLNALYYKYEREGPTFRLSIRELKGLLGLEKERDNERIYQAISILQHPIQIRNFHYEKDMVAWISAPFLARAIQYKNQLNFVEFTIDPIVLEALRQKAGYTPLDLRVCNRFKTKYGLKLYEMYRRYYSLPHKEACIKNRAAGIVKKDLTKLNILFGSNFTYPSQMLRAIKRGLEEIYQITQVSIHCFYTKKEKLFIFSWEREIDLHYPSPTCIIPTKQVNSFIKWYTKNVVEEKIEHKNAYIKELKNKILENSFYNLKEFYSYYLQELGFDPDQCFNQKRKKFTC